jgi:N-acetylmuramoyl-L-alanine amidase
VVLRLARDLGEALRARGFEVRLTRDGDDDRDAGSRAAFANGFGADLLLSLHADGWFDARVRGTTLYVQRAGGGSVADPLAFVPWDAVQQRHAGAANEFALDLQHRLEKAGLLPVRGVVPGDFPLLRSLDMPAVLIEAGFLTHAGDAEFLDDAGDRRRLAETIADAVAALRDRHQNGDGKQEGTR